MTYLLDANVFIHAKNTYYGFDTAPGFWEWLKGEHERGTVCSISAVYDELARQEDELTEWARAMPETFWLREDAATLPHLQDVVEWTMAPERRFRDTARTEFLAAADYRLLAAARAWTMTIATHEKSSPESVRRVLIPDVCRNFDVPVTSAHALFRQLGLRLVHDERASGDT